MAMKSKLSIKQLEASNILSQTESRGILAICALNKLERKREIHKRFKLGNLQFSFHWGDKKSMWGRFGGGWQWALGFEFSGQTLLLNCLVFSLVVSKQRKETNDGNIYTITSS